MKTEQNNIWHFVKELLHEQDCVIVPGFGGFVCNFEHSKIDQVTHIIIPPSKHVVFNQNLKNNDGLLANKISEKINITYSEAIHFIEENVASTKRILEEKKILVVDFFGSFRLNADANFVFLPDKQNNFLYSSFGLIPLTAEPVLGRSIKSGKARIFKDRKQVRVAKKSKRTRNAVRILASTFVLLLAVNFYVFVKDPHLKITGTTMNISSWFDSLFHQQTIPEIKVEAQKPLPIAKQETFIPPPPEDISAIPILSDSLNLTNLNTENNSIKKLYGLDLMAFADSIAATKLNISAPVLPEKIETSETKIIEEQPINEKPIISKPLKIKTENISSDSNFYIIGGVFCKENNAKKFFHQLEESGFSPEIIVNERVNCNRVSYAKFSSRKEAVQQLRAIHASTNPDAWIFVKHN